MSMPSKGNGFLFYDISQIEGSSIVSDAKGYYSFDKMCGRSTRNYLSYFPNPHESRFDNWDNTMPR